MTNIGNRVRRELEDKKNGLLQCFIFREKKQNTFYFYSGSCFNDQRHRFLMMAKWYPELSEFRIYTVNAYK